MFLELREPPGDEPILDSDTWDPDDFDELSEEELADDFEDDELPEDFIDDDEEL